MTWGDSTAPGHQRGGGIEDAICTCLPPFHWASCTYVRTYISHDREEPVTTVGIRDLARRASAIVRCVRETGEPAIVTDRGRPWASCTRSTRTFRGTTPCPCARVRHELTRGRRGPGSRPHCLARRAARCRLTGLVDSRQVATARSRSRRLTILATRNPRVAVPATSASSARSAVEGAPSSRRSATAATGLDPAARRGRGSAEAGRLPSLPEARERGGPGRGREVHEGLVEHGGSVQRGSASPLEHVNSNPVPGGERRGVAPETGYPPETKTSGLEKLFSHRACSPSCARALTLRLPVDQADALEIAVPSPLRSRPAVRTRSCASACTRASSGPGRSSSASLVRRPRGWEAESRR